MILDNIDRTICRLFFGSFGNTSCNMCITCLGIANVIETEASVSVVGYSNFDMTDKQFTNQ
jgi:hypothetical protein